KYLTLFFITGAVLLTAYFIPMFMFIEHHRFINTLLNVFFKSAVLSAIFISASYYLRVSVDLNDFIKLVLSGKIFKGGHKLEEL
ncbi:MAG: hypothetical protein LC096_04615, partial [Bacteroidia bacterium]|nr:hypothetical protein [Bacteroidia bacterium]